MDTTTLEDFTVLTTLRAEEDYQPVAEKGQARRPVLRGQGVRLMADGSGNQRLLRLEDFTVLTTLRAEED